MKIKKLNIKKSPRKSQKKILKLENQSNNKKLRNKQTKYMDIFSTNMLNNGNPAKLLIDHIIKVFCS